MFMCCRSKWYRYRLPSFTKNLCLLKHFQLQKQNSGLGGTLERIISSSHGGPRTTHLYSSQGPGAGNSCTSVTSGAQKAGQMSGRTPANVWDVLLNTNDLLLPPLPFSPWRAARTGWWKAKIKCAFKSNSIPLFHISLPIIPLQLPAFNPAPVFSAYKA